MALRYNFITPADTIELISSNWHPISLAITAYTPANSQHAVAVSMEKTGMAVGSSQKLRSFMEWCRYYVHYFQHRYL